MTTQEVAQALVAWAMEHNAEILGSYTYPAALKNERIPDVAADAQRVLVSDADTRFPEQALEQVRLRIYEMELSFVVPGDPPEAGTNLLRTFADRLMAEAVKDRTLGGRVPFIGNEMTASFEPPFVEFEDGQRGRFMTLELAVAEEA